MMYRYLESLVLSDSSRGIIMVEDYNLVSHADSAIQMVM